ncbi:phage capsid protein [Symbiopectobacterium sp.]|uniref:phage capsid protein n=1 Tax=Symbiopectobacterium sp. TaxID=2952789 RepID=UPI003F2CF070
MESELIIDGQAVSLSENQETAQETTNEQQAETREEQVHDEAQKPEEQSESEQAEEQPDEQVLQIGDEEVSLQDDDENIDGKPAPQWIKDLRKGFKETQKENRELKRQLEELHAKPAEQSPAIAETLPPKPTLESYDYDEARFEQAVTDWHEKKSRVEQVQKQKQQQQQEYQQRFQQRVEAHRQRAAKLPVKDYAEMEEVARAEVSDLHKEILIHAADEGSELIAYALGKNQQLRQRLAAEKDPIRAAYMLGQMSRDVSLRPAPKAKQTPKPEPEVRGGAANAKIDDFQKSCPGAIIE